MIFNLPYDWIIFTKRIMKCEAFLKDDWSIKVKLEVDITPWEEKPKANPEKFYVTLEQVWFRENAWKKQWDLDDKNKVIVIVDCTEEMIVRSFVEKCHKQNDNIGANKQWRVFSSNNLPGIFVWRFTWEKRQEYLINFMDGDKTLKDIGIGPKRNHLVYFFQTQFKNQEEP